LLNTNLFFKLVPKWGEMDGVAVETFLYNAEDGNVARFQKNPKDAVITDYDKLVRVIGEILR
jgi:hypothetical protein